MRALISTPPASHRGRCAVRMTAKLARERGGSLLMEPFFPAASAARQERRRWLAAQVGSIRSVFPICANVLE